MIFDLIKMTLNECSIIDIFESESCEFDYFFFEN